MQTLASVGRNSRKTEVNVHVKQPDDGHIRLKYVVKNAV
jgi:hypothetical protein